MSYFSAVHHRTPKEGSTTSLLPSQQAKLRQLFEDYRMHAEDEEALVRLVRTIDPTLIHQSIINERLAKVGYVYRESPILEYDQIERLAITTPAFLEPPLPKDEKETVDAFVQLGGQPDRGGFISSETMRETLNNYKLLLDVQAVMNEVDTDGSGTIEYEEFEAFYRQKRSSIAGTVLRTISNTSLSSGAAHQLLSDLLMNGDGDHNDEQWHDYASFASFGSISDNEYVLDEGETIINAADAQPPPVHQQQQQQGNDNNNTNQSLEMSPSQTVAHDGDEKANNNDDSAAAVDISINSGAASPSPTSDRFDVSFAGATNVGSPQHQQNRSGVSWSPYQGGATSTRGGSPAGASTRGGRPRSSTQARLLSRQLQQVLQGHSSKMQDVNTKYSKLDFTESSADIPAIAAESCARTAAENRRKAPQEDTPRPPSIVPSCYHKHTRNSIQRQPLNIQLHHPLPPSSSRPTSAQQRSTPASSRPTSARRDSAGPFGRRRHSSLDSMGMASGIQQADEENKGIKRRERTLEQLLRDAEKKVEAFRGELGTSRPTSAQKKKERRTSFPSHPGDPMYDDTDGFIQEDNGSEYDGGFGGGAAARNPHRPTSARVGGGGKPSGRPGTTPRPLTAPGPRGGQQQPHLPLHRKGSAQVLPSSHRRPFTATQHHPRRLQVEPATESALFRGRDFYSYFASTAPKSATRSSSRRV